MGLAAVLEAMTVNEIGQAREVHPVPVSQWKKVTRNKPCCCLTASALSD